MKRFIPAAFLIALAAAACDTRADPEGYETRVDQFADNTSEGIDQSMEATEEAVDEMTDNVPFAGNENVEPMDREGDNELVDDEIEVIGQDDSMADNAEENWDEFTTNADTQLDELENNLADLRDRAEEAGDELSDETAEAINNAEATLEQVRADLEDAGDNADEEMDEFRENVESTMENVRSELASLHDRVSNAMNNN